MDQKYVWNKIADSWSNFRTKPEKKLVKFAKGKKGKILDVGCGNCRNLIPFKGCELYGIDVSENMIEYAKKFCKKHELNVDLKVGDAAELPYDDNYFDCVICLAALHTMRERKNVVNEIFRIMKPGSSAFISVWYKEGKKEGFIPWKKKDEILQRYYYFFDKDELKNLLASSGFKVVKIWISGNRERELNAEVVKPL